MPFCAAPFCSNRSPRDTKRGISFHRLPISNAKIAKKWLVKLGREEKFLPNRAQIFVCSEHFTEDCFEVDYRHNLLGGATHKRKKKFNAVPTIFKKTYSVPQVRRIASERRQRGKSICLHVLKLFHLVRRVSFSLVTFMSLFLVKSGII